MTTQDVSRIVWYGIFLALVFGPLELLARDLLGVAPWWTASKTIQNDIHKYPWSALIVATIGVGVTVHWLFDQRFWPSLACAFSWALSAHLLDNKWP